MNRAHCPEVHQALSIQLGTQPRIRLEEDVGREDVFVIKAGVDGGRERCQDR